MCKDVTAKPFDLNAPEQDIEEANRWWRSLSINEMKSFEKKYFPNLSSYLITRRRIHQMWEREYGKNQH